MHEAHSQHMLDNLERMWEAGFASPSAYLGKSSFVREFTTFEMDERVRVWPSW